MSDADNGDIDEDVTIEEWATKPKHRLSHLSRMAGNIAAGLAQNPSLRTMYDDDSYTQRIAEEAVAISEAVLDELVRVEVRRAGR